MRLFWKIYIASLGLLILSALLLTAAISYREADRSMVRLRAEHRLLATLAASQVEAGYHEKIWPFEMLSAIAHEPAFTSWQVVDGASEVILSDRPPLAGEAITGGVAQAGDASLVSPKLVLGPKADTEAWVVPMRMRTGSCPWTFRLEYSSRSVREHVRQLIVNNLLCALGVSVLLLPISLFCTRRFLRPLGSLSDAVRQMESGNLLVNLPPAGRDEVGQLVSSFGGMARTIHHERAELENRVQERTRELELAKAAAEAATRSKSAFLANMSHEIRTPMTAILGYADLMLDPNQDLSQRLNYLYTLRRNGEHLLTIINDILDLSKIEASKMTIERIACSPARIVAEVDSLMRGRATEKGLDMNFRALGPLPETIQTDPTRLRQILVNLISNAIKFTSSGGIKMTVEMIAGCAEASPKLRIAITDTGIGLTAEEAGRLFQPFMQADDSTTRRFGGTGLGLSISRGLAEMLGGSIELSSTKGQGSTFTVTITTGMLEGVRMIEYPEMLAQEITDGQLQRPARKLSGRVLLAEDGPDNRIILSLFLKDAGLDVTVVENGQLGYEQAMAAWDVGQAFGVVLMDLQMPELDGYAATAKLRGRGYTGPVIALTAHAMSEERDRCIKAGCDDFASKPINRDQLVDMVAKHLAADGWRQGAPRAATAAAPAREPVASPEPPVAASSRRENAEAVGEFAPGSIKARPPIESPAMRTAVNGFVRRLPARVQKMESLLAEGSWDELRREAHQLKGAGTSYGFPEITQRAAQAEGAIKAAAEPQQCTAAVEKLLHLIRCVEGYDAALEVSHVA